ncbi:(2Fe-2S)-binding protein, partial [Streptomyces asiaticus]
MLLPAFATDELERELSALGFTTFLRAPSGTPVERDGLRIMITALTGPGDGPIGDSALSLDDGRTVLLNQNDAHPLDIAAIREFGEVDAYFVQFSGAIWYPMVYQLPLSAKKEFAARKRQGQFDRALRYIDAVEAKHVFPNAGPPCFLDDELFEHNGTGQDGESIFVDQLEFLRQLGRARPRVAAHLLLPGTVAEPEHTACKLTHRYTETEIEHIFGEKPAYLREFAGRQRAALATERASRSPALPRERLLTELKQWWEPLLTRADRICAGVGGPARLDVGEVPIVIDFPAREVRLWDGERCRYTLSTSADLVATNIERREVDWSNSLLLSMRFTASRIGPYNEFLYVFFKCLSMERIEYVENYYDSCQDDGQDIVLDGWQVQRRCPHLRGFQAGFAEIGGVIGTLVSGVFLYAIAA